MKKCVPIFSRAALLTALFLAAIPVAPAADDGSNAAPGPSPDPAFVNAPEQVRIDLLDLSMPEEKFITFLPDLLDKNKIEKAVPELLEAVKRKEMTLEGYPVLVTKSGQRTETQATAAPEFIPPPDQYLPPMMHWEQRGVGVYIEVEPIIDVDNRHIELNLNTRHIELLGYEKFPVSKEKNIPAWDDTGPYQPIYFTMKVTTCVSLLSGQHMLLAVHKKFKPEGTVEIFILHAELITVGR